MTNTTKKMIIEEEIDMKIIQEMTIIEMIEMKKDTIEKIIIEEINIGIEIDKQTRKHIEVEAEIEVEKEEIIEIEDKY